MTIKVTIQHDDANSPWDLLVKTMQKHPDGEAGVLQTQRVKSGERAEFLYVSSSQYLVVRETEREPQQES